MTLEFGVFLPTSTPDPDVPVLGDVGEAARLAEGLGLDSIWSTDHLIASAPILDSTAVLGAAASVTERIRIGYGVMLLALRPAAWAAKQISTLQYLSHDRLELGIGTGGVNHGDVGWRAAGQPFADRGARTDEALRSLPSLISGKPTLLPDGTEAAINPGSTVPPILIGGDSVRARRRAAEFGEGWISVGTPVEDIAKLSAQLADFAAVHGRSTPYVIVVAPPLAADRKQALDQLAAYAAAGTRRIVLPPNGTDWRAVYENAAAFREELAADS